MSALEGPPPQGILRVWYAAPGDPEVFEEPERPGGAPTQWWWIADGILNVVLQHRAPRRVRCLPLGARVIEWESEGSQW